MQYDVVIVGAGPAGLFAAKEIAKKSNLKTLIIDVGRDVDERICPATAYKICSKCSPCSVMCGVGGAGTLSSCLLNLRIDIGGDLGELVGEETAWRLVEYVDDVFVENGAPKKVYSPSQEEVEDLERKAAAVGVRFISIPQRHIGTDNAPKVIKNLKENLERKGVKFLLKKRVSRIHKGSVTINNGAKISGEYVLVAPGRSGAHWLAQEAQRLKIPTEYQPIDIGVRVEVPAVIMDPVIRISRDPKFHIYSDTYDDFVRTFCLPPEEPVIWKKNGVIYVTPILDVPEGASVLSLDFERAVGEFVPILRKTRRYYDGKILKIRLSRGAEIRTTRDHIFFARDKLSKDEKHIIDLIKQQGPMRSYDISKRMGVPIHQIRQNFLKNLLKLGYVRRTKKGKNVFYAFVKEASLLFSQKKASDLKVGDVLPTLQEIPKPQLVVKELNLIEDFVKYAPKSLLRNVYVRNCKSYIESIKRDRKTTFKDILGNYQHTTIQINKFLSIVEKYGIQREHLLNLRIGVEGSKIVVPAILPLNHDLARILGTFVSEGNYNYNPKRHNYNIAFTLPEEDMQRELITSVERVLSKINHVYTNTADKKRGTQIVFPSKLFCILLRYVFDIPSGAPQKRLPRYTYNMPKSVQYEILSALLDGDGHVGKDGVYYTTSSSLLKSQLSYFLITHNFPFIQRGISQNRNFAPEQIHQSDNLEYYIEISGKQNQKNLAKHLTLYKGSNRIGAQELLEVIPKYDNMVQIPYYLQQLYAQNVVREESVVEIVEEEYSGYVYDFSVPPYRNFVAGTKPIVIHNCVNSRGFVVQEVYDDFVGVNGHSMTDELSENTNFGFLVRVGLTKPLEDTTAYGRTIAMQTTTLGGGKPLLQRLGDLKGGRRSTWERLKRGNVKPTLLNVTPGDVSMGLPHRIVTDLIEGLNKLDHVIPGVSSNSTLIYAPEVKFSANRIHTNENLETPVENLFVAGDGAGLSRGLVTSAATGVIAAWGILKKEGIGASL